MASFQQLQKDAELAASNNRIVAVAAALQGKFAIVKQYDDSLALIQIHSADSLFTPGHKRMTPFDVNLTATVYCPLSAGSSLYTVTDSWKSFVAYDLVAIFSSPFPAGQQLQSFNVPANWLNALDALAARPSETIRSIFADEHVINGLLRSAGFAVATTQRAHCAGRRESYGAIGPLSMVPRLSIGH